MRAHKFELDVRPHLPIMPQEFSFNWQWDIQSKPEAIWPLASDTNRFNRDTGQPGFREL